MRIFIDMDGVLVDFVRGAVSTFGKEYDDLMTGWVPGVYNIEEIIGISKTQFFKKIDASGEDFWANLPPYPYAREFYEHCAAMAPTYILTAPTLHPTSFAGKICWLHNWFGTGFRDYVFTPKKEMCARDTHILIDDHVPNVEKFKEHGGHAILWPTWFNYRYAEAHKAVDVAKEELEALRRGLFGSSQPERRT